MKYAAAGCGGLSGRVGGARRIEVSGCGERKLLCCCGQNPGRRSVLTTMRPGSGPELYLTKQRTQPTNKERSDPQFYSHKVHNEGSALCVGPDA